MVSDLTDADRYAIASAVARAEATTSVELRMVLARWSGDYTEYALIYAGLFALIAGGIAAAVRPGLTAEHLFSGQAVLFVAAALVLQWRPLRTAVVPAAVKRKAAWRQARLHYASIGLKQPHLKSAVLVFASQAERSVEILVDDAVAEKLPERAWAPVVSAFRREFAQGNIARAYADAAGACAALLAPVFPPQAGQVNEIPDTLEEI